VGAVLDYAREHGDSEFMPQFYIGGVLIPTIAGGMNEPTDRPGKTLTITLDAATRATAALNAAVEYKVRVTNIIGTETKSRFKGRIARRRFATRVDDAGRPADVLTIDCISYMAERCRIAPGTLHIIYDPNKIDDGTSGEGIAQRVLDTRPAALRDDSSPAFTAVELAKAVPKELQVKLQDLPFDEDGNRIQPVFEAHAGLTLQYLLERCLEAGCGFTDATMAIPNYAIGRLDVRPDSGWFDAVAALLQPHEPIWIEDEAANTIAVKQPEWSLPVGYVPPEIHLDLAIPTLSDSTAEILNQIEVVYRHNGAAVAVDWASYRHVDAPPDEATALTAALIDYAQSLLNATQQAISNNDGGAAVWLAAKAVASATVALAHANTDGDPTVIAQATTIYNDSITASNDAAALSDGQDDYIFSTTFQYPPAASIDGAVTTTEWRTDIDFRAKSNPDVILSSQLLTLVRETVGPDGLMSRETLDNYYDGRLKIGHFKSTVGKVPGTNTTGVIEEEACEIQWEKQDGDYVQVRQAALKAGIIVVQNVVQGGVLLPKLTPAMQANTGQIDINTEAIPQSNEWGDIELDVERNITSPKEGLTLQEKFTHDLITGNIKDTQSWTRTGKPVLDKPRRYQYGGGGAGSHAGAEVRVLLTDAASAALYGVRKAGTFDAGEIPREIAFALARLLMQPEPAQATLELPDPDFDLKRGEVRRIFDRDGDQGLFVCTGTSESWGEGQWLAQTADFRRRREVS
jgi:hypothetical protein